MASMALSLNLSSTCYLSMLKLGTLPGIRCLIEHSLAVHPIIPVQARGACTLAEP